MCKNITELTNLMKNGSVYIVVAYCKNSENGEIQGVIAPSSSGK